MVFWKTSKGKTTPPTTPTGLNKEGSLTSGGLSERQSHNIDPSLKTPGLSPPMLNEKSDTGDKEIDEDERWEIESIDVEEEDLNDSIRSTKKSPESIKKNSKEIESIDAEEEDLNDSIPSTRKSTESIKKNLKEIESIDAEEEELNDSIPSTKKSPESVEKNRKEIESIEVEEEDLNVSIPSTKRSPESVIKKLKTKQRESSGGHSSTAVPEWKNAAKDFLRTPQSSIEIVVPATTTKKPLMRIPSISTTVSSFGSGTRSGNESPPAWKEAALDFRTILTSKKAATPTEKRTPSLLQINYLSEFTDSSSSSSRKSLPPKWKVAAMDFKNSIHKKSVDGNSRNNNNERLTKKEKESSSRRSNKTVVPLSSFLSKRDQTHCEKFIQRLSAGRKLAAEQARVEKFVHTVRD